MFNLKTAVEREKAVQTIDVHREFKQYVVTLWVMSQFLNFLGASGGSADFRDPTAVCRFKVETLMIRKFSSSTLSPLRLFKTPISWAFRAC